MISGMGTITSLSEFIASMGDEAFSRQFDVKERTVASWRRGERIPRPIQARRLVEKSGGDLTMAMIYSAAGVVENQKEAA